MIISWWECQMPDGPMPGLRMADREDQWLGLAASASSPERPLRLRPRPNTILWGFSCLLDEFLLFICYRICFTSVLCLMIPLLYLAPFRNNKFAWNWQIFWIWIDGDATPHTTRQLYYDLGMQLRNLQRLWVYHCEYLKLKTCYNLLWNRKAIVPKTWDT